MAKILETSVGDREIHVGPRGGRYILNDSGERIYVAKCRRRDNTFKPRRGAYKRFLDAQRETI